PRPAPGRRNKGTVAAFPSPRLPPGEHRRPDAPPGPGRRHGHGWLAARDARGVDREEELGVLRAELLRQRLAVLGEARLAARVIVACAAICPAARAQPPPVGGGARPGPAEEGAG